MQQLLYLYHPNRLAVPKDLVLLVVADHLLASCCYANYAKLMAMAFTKNIQSFGKMQDKEREQLWNGLLTSQNTLNKMGDHI